MKKLEKINYDNSLSEFNLAETKPCDDRLMTEVHLFDFDWMNYQFVVYLPTKKQGFLKVTTEYNGFVTSEMSVIQEVADKKFSHFITFDTELFVDFIKKFMTAHIAQWDKNTAFCEDEMAVEFFNTVLDNAISYDIHEVVQEEEEMDNECDECDEYDEDEYYYEDEEDFYDDEEEDDYED